MIPKITELTTLTFAVEDLNFTVNALRFAGRVYTEYREHANQEGRSEDAKMYDQQRKRCFEVARAIALVGQQGIG